MKTKFKLFLAVLIAGAISCTDAEFERATSYGQSFKVEMYSGGQLVRTWNSTGKVLSEEGSDGYFFKDSATGKLLEISGDIVITLFNTRYFSVVAKSELNA